MPPKKHSNLSVKTAAAKRMASARQFESEEARATRLILDQQRTAAGRQFESEEARATRLILDQQQDTIDTFSAEVELHLYLFKFSTQLPLQSSTNMPLKYFRATPGPLS